MAWVRGETYWSIGTVISSVRPWRGEEEEGRGGGRGGRGGGRGGRGGSALTLFQSRLSVSVWRSALSIDTFNLQFYVSALDLLLIRDVLRFYPTVTVCCVESRAEQEDELQRQIFWRNKHLESLWKLLWSVCLVDRVIVVFLGLCFICRPLAALLCGFVPVVHYVWWTLTGNSVCENITVLHVHEMKLVLSCSIFSSQQHTI